MFKRQLANRKGNAIIEFAIVLPLLLGILGGAIDFGLAFFVSHVVQNAAREGARYAVARVNLSDNDPAVTARVQERLPNAALFLPFRNAITTSRLGCDVNVQVTGTSPYFFLQVLGFSQPMTITRTVTMRYEHKNDICDPRPQENAI